MMEKKLKENQGSTKLKDIDEKIIKVQREIGKGEVDIRTSQDQLDSLKKNEIKFTTEIKKLTIELESANRRK